MKNRKTKSMFGQVLEKRLMHNPPWLNSEDLPNYLQFYVSTELIDQIRNNSNHLIVGRRGTGKTHLLGAFNETIRRAKRRDELCIKLSFAEFSITLPTYSGESPDFIATRHAKLLFKEFLRLFFNEFLDEANTCLERHWKPSVDAAAYIKLKSEVDNSLEKLLENIEIGFPVADEVVSERKDQSTEHSKGGAGGGIKAGLTNFVKPTLEIEGKIEKGKSRDTSFEITKNTKSIYSVNLHEVRKSIERVLELLEIDVLYVLLDEWMELDKNTTYSVQPPFSQLLKIVFFNSKRIAIKIASIWQATNLYDRKDMRSAMGIQIGHDIDIGVDLDTTFLTDESAVTEFCKNMLFKRLVHLVPELSDLECNGKVDDIFISELFDNDANFAAYIAAAHGIPRDLMDIFNKCALSIEKQFHSCCIDYRSISKISRNRYTFQKRRGIESGSTAQQLLVRINDYLEAKEQRFFLVENNQVAESMALRKLVDEEVIHQIPSAVCHRSIRDTHKVFHIDFGNYVDWIETRKRDLVEVLDETIMARFPSDFDSRINEYVIEIEDLLETQIVCDRCNESFSQKNPVFSKFSCCPYCANEIGGGANPLADVA